MSERSPPPTESDANRGSASVEQLCQQFLERWQQGRPKPIERVLSKASAADQKRLLRGLLIVELRCRRKAGDDPQPAEYSARFPDDSALISQAFEMVPPARRKAKDPAADDPPERPQRVAEKP